MIVFDIINLQTEDIKEAFNFKCNVKESKKLNKEEMLNK